MDRESIRQWTERIDREIEACRPQLIEDTVRMIAVKSVKGEPQPGAPFGPGPRAMQEEALRMGREAGFYTEDYRVGVVSLALKPGQPDLGIWLHGDVVPEGDGWEHPPYRATQFKGCIIGRGATDNKGQLAAIFRILTIFKALGVPLSYNPALYVGSDEESGMHDMIGVPGQPGAEGFLNVARAPRLSLVPDGSFPVGYGGKGSVTVVIRSREPLHGLTLTAGLPEDPGKAEAVTASGTVVTRTPPRHGAHPDPNGNMITRLMERLLEDPATDPADRPLLDYFRQVSLDTGGKGFGIDVPSAHMPPATVNARKIVTEDGCPAMTLNIRYPIELTAEEIADRITESAEKAGARVVSAEKGTPAYLLDPESPLVVRLTEISNAVTGENRPPYTMGGGTYAHRLPNAYVFGMDGCLKPEGYPAGRGGAHGLDELVSVDRLQRAMRIYARALLELDGMEW